jgi:hypothetical protein
VERSSSILRVGGTVKNRTPLVFGALASIIPYWVICFLNLKDMLFIYPIHYNSIIDKTEIKNEKRGLLHIAYRKYAG